VRCRAAERVPNARIGATPQLLGQTTHAHCGPRRRRAGGGDAKIPVASHQRQPTSVAARRLYPPLPPPVARRVVAKPAKKTGGLRVPPTYCARPPPCARGVAVGGMLPLPLGVGGRRLVDAPLATAVVPHRRSAGGRATVWWPLCRRGAWAASSVTGKRLPPWPYCPLPHGGVPYWQQATEAPPAAIGHGVRHVVCGCVVLNISSELAR